MLPTPLLGLLCCLPILGFNLPLATSADAPAPKPVHTFEAPGLRGAAFSPTERLLVTWEQRFKEQPGRVILWEMTIGKKRRELTEHDGEVWGASFSLDGSRLAACGQSAEDTTTYVWDVKSGKKIVQVSSKYGMSRVTFSPNGQSLATSGTDRIVRVWDIKSQKVIASHTCDEMVNTVAFSPDGRLLVAGCDDGAVWVWGEDGQPKGRKLRAHAQDVRAVVFSPDGKLLVSGSLDRTCIVWKTEDWKPAKVLEPAQSGVFCLAFSRDGKMLAAGSAVSIPPGVELKDASTGCVTFYSMEKFEKIGTLRPHVASVLSVSFSSDGQYLATMGGESFLGVGKASAKVWKMEDVLPRNARD